MNIYEPGQWKNYRVNQDVTAKDLADRMGVTVTTVHRWEAGTRNPSVYDVVRMAHHLGIPIWKILSDTANDGENHQAILACEDIRAAKQESMMTADLHPVGGQPERC
ncbi:helix-turn-helix transcriptional regulator [Actinacidiphila oryziradicis]|uniref:helix-turn-helix transcriptional regulator n=1 Tax=Actinacidiphila oryziradicis TaxID=2571141 RepID=UPI0023EF9DCF|nr:helix-turn-helix transcriptional regulator [Actinacidiphila oryziradicis]MCW2873523.1 family transcriptional regulator [Actinacidiphila oryziradicis]